jgi:hypothetical protein
LELLWLVEKNFEEEKISLRATAGILIFPAR